VSNLATWIFPAERQVFETRDLFDCEQDRQRLDYANRGPIRSVSIERYKNGSLLKPETLKTILRIERKDRTAACFGFIGKRFGHRSVMDRE